MLALKHGLQHNICELQGALMQQKNRKTAGFTLVELAIVLVILGLLAGGVLVGQDLIKSAQTSAQLAQIENYNGSVNAFITKYHGLPGDLKLSTATAFNLAIGSGATACDGVTPGKRNGDGLIDGTSSIYYQTVGETALFWEDLTNAGLLDGVFPATGAFNCGTTPMDLGYGAFPPISTALPTSKISGNNHIYIIDYNNANWFGIAGIQSIQSTGVGMGLPNTTPNLNVTQAYNMDQKVDDGNPTIGHVVAMYTAATPPTPVVTSPAANLYTAPNAATDSVTTCYNSTTSAYSNAFNGGAGNNCALMFQFQ